jgi:tryptophan synthase alpha chain
MTRNKSVISRTIAALRLRKEAALIIYATAGFPTLAGSFRRIGQIVHAGADMIEIGVPFSDPVADGPMIQHASQTALRAGTTLKKIICGIRSLKPPVPVILMSYLNPILAYGEERFMRDINDAGVAGLVIPDLPYAEAGGISAQARACGIDLIFIVAPTTPSRVVKLIARKTRGFIYVASIPGTTGERKQLPPNLNSYLLKIRRLTRKPLCVGFGVSTPGQAAILSGLADGVIVGSRIVKAIRKREDLHHLVAAFKAATRRDRKC